MFGSCYPRQAYIKLFTPPLTVPEIEGFPPTIENPYDMISLKDEERILSPANPQILLQFQKTSPQEGQIRKLLVGNCKLLDAKNEKNMNFEVLLILRSSCLRTTSSATSCATT